MLDGLEISLQVMNSAEEEIVSFSPEVIFRGAVELRFTQLQKTLAEILKGAEILHVGSTAVPGSLTKGDLDIQVRVPKEDFPRAKVLLQRLFAVNEGGFSDEGAISFEDFSAELPAGIHLTAKGGSSDIQYKFRDLLVASSSLRRQYDDLKRQYEGQSMEAYRTAKAEFVSRVLGGRSSEP